MNNLTIAGNIGKDAELRTTQNGKDVASFTVAVSNGKNKDATWFDCSIWGDRAAKLQPYIRKGDKITVSGEVSAREHNGKAYLQLFVREVTLQGVKRQDDGYPDSTGTTGGTAYGRQIEPIDDLNDEIPW